MSIEKFLSEVYTPAFESVNKSFSNVIKEIKKAINSGDLNLEVTIFGKSVSVYSNFHAAISNDKKESILKKASSSIITEINALFGNYDNFINTIAEEVKETIKSTGKGDMSVDDIKKRISLASIGVGIDKDGSVWGLSVDYNDGGILSNHRIVVEDVKNGIPREKIMLHG